MSDSLRPHGLWPARLLCPRDSLGQNTGVGCRTLLWGIFWTQGSNLRNLVSCIRRRVLYHQRHLGKPEFQSIVQMLPFLAVENPFRLTSEFFLSLFLWSLKNFCFYHLTICPRTFLNFSCPSLEISYFFKNSGSFQWKIVIGNTVQVLSVHITTKTVIISRLFWRPEVGIRVFLFVCLFFFLFFKSNTF